MKHARSEALFRRAVKTLPGGVNSPVRAFGSVGMEPVFIKKAEGSRLTDEDGNQYIDYIGSWGPMILGHNPPILTESLTQAMKHGFSFGLPSSVEIDLAEQIREAYPAAEMIRMVNSGTEATMSAVRAARGWTGRDKIIKFEGCYHGHSDGLLVKSGSGALTYGVPTSPGVPAEIVKHTIVCQYNNLQSAEDAVSQYPGQIAAMIIEPIAGNMGLVPAFPDFLHGLRKLCSKENIVLIFDEVISGFRVSYGGAAELYGICPDMVCFGKIIGGGLPVGAYGGKKEIMEMVSPAGPVYQAGTLSGNPLAMHLGGTLLTWLKQHPDTYGQLEQAGEFLENGMNQCLQRLSLPFRINRVGSLLTVFFTNRPVQSYEDVQSCDTEAFACYFRSMLENGVMAGPSQYEAMFLSAAHTQNDLDQTLEAFEQAMQQVKEQGFRPS